MTNLRSVPPPATDLTTPHAGSRLTASLEVTSRRHSPLLAITLEMTWPRPGPAPDPPPPGPPDPAPPAISTAR